MNADGITARAARRTVWFLLPVCVAGCTVGSRYTASPQRTPQQDEQDIRAFTKNYADAFAAEQPTSVLSLMTDDFVALSPGKPPIVGLEATRREVTSDLAEMDVHELCFEPMEIVVKGDWAWTWGLSKASFTAGESSETVHVSGKYLWILCRSADGSWRIARDSAQAD